MTVRHVDGPVRVGLSEALEIVLARGVAGKEVRVVLATCHQGRTTLVSGVGVGDVAVRVFVVLACLAGEVGLADGKAAETMTVRRRVMRKMLIMLREFGMSGNKKDVDVFVFHPLRWTALALYLFS